MANQTHPGLRAVAPGIVLALLAILFGFMLGGSFGAAEASVRGRVRASAGGVFDSA